MVRHIVLASVLLAAASRVGFNVRAVAVEYDVNDQKLSCLGRSAKLAAVDGRIDLHILVDRLSIEVFANDGAVSMTYFHVFDPKERSVQIFSAGDSLLASDFVADVLQFVISTNASTYAEGAFANIPVNGLVSLGAIYDLLVDARDLSFEYTILGQPTINGNVIYIPEPASLLLMGMGSLLILRRRQA